MTIYVMLREVCLKHRNNRREIFLRVRTQIRVGSGVGSFLSKQCGAGASIAPAPLICGHRPRAGCLNANAWRGSAKLTSCGARSAQPPGRQSGDAGAIPADRTNFQGTRCVQRAPACAVRSPKPVGLGAAPGRRAISSGLPWPSRQGIRLLNGTTQVRLLPGAPIFQTEAVM